MLELRIIMVLVICVFAGYAAGSELKEDKLEEHMNRMNDELNFYRTRRNQWIYPGKGKWH